MQLKDIAKVDSFLHMTGKLHVVVFCFLLSVFELNQVQYGNMPSFHVEPKISNYLIIWSKFVEYSKLFVGGTSFALMKGIDFSTLSASNFFTLQLGLVSSYGAPASK